MGEETEGERAPSSAERGARTTEGPSTEAADRGPRACRSVVSLRLCRMPKIKGKMVMWSRKHDEREVRLMEDRMWRQQEEDARYAHAHACMPLRTRRVPHVSSFGAPSALVTPHSRTSCRRHRSCVPHTATPLSAPHSPRSTASSSTPTRGP